MNTSSSSSHSKLSRLSDTALHERARQASRQERHALSESVRCLSEVARRKLYLKYGHASLPVYARKELQYSEASAFRHAQAAWLALEFPELLNSLESGEHSLDSLVQVAQTFREVDHPQVALRDSAQKTEARALQPALKLATRGSVSGAGGLMRKPTPPVKLTRKDKREVLKAIAARPRTEVQRTLAQVRFVYSSTGQVSANERGEVPSAALFSPNRPDSSLLETEQVPVSLAQALASADLARLKPPRPRARLQSHDGTWSELRVCFSREQEAKLQRLRSLLSHAIPGGDWNALFDRMLEESLDRHDPVRKEQRAQARREKQAAQRRKDSAPANASFLKTKASPTHNALFSRMKSVNDERREENSGSQEQKKPSKDGANDPSRTASPEAPAGSKTPEIFHVKSREAKRTPIPAAVRREVRIRDGNRCQYQVQVPGKAEIRVCGSERYADIDHITPVSQGGSNDPANLRIVCAGHNRNRMHIE